MTIKKKLFVTMIIANSTLLIISMMVFFGYRYVMSKGTLANNFDKESMYLQMMLRGLNEIIINEGTPDSIETAMRGIDGFNRVHNSLTDEIEDQQLLDRINEKIDFQWQRISKDIDPFLEHYLNLEHDDVMVRLGTLITDTESVINEVNKLSEETRVLVDRNSIGTKIAQHIMIIIIIMVLLASVILSRQIYHSITSPIEELNAIAAGFTRGDLNNRMDDSRKDEFGTLALHFNKSIVKLKQYNKELKDFARIASHDLQEPLRKIIAYSSRLQVKYPEAFGDDGSDYLERMQRASRRMKRLIEGLLAYSNIMSTAQPFIPVDLSITAEQVISEMKGRIQKVDAKVEVENMPTLKADPRQMRQVFFQMIKNALKYHKKEEKPVVKVSGMLVSSDDDSLGQSFHGDAYQITFEDNGIGFEDKYSDRIFAVFQRLHSLSEYDGTGIGLSLCRKIVERHGGSIQATSVSGKGSKFIITLPAIHGGHNADMEIS